MATTPNDSSSKGNNNFGLPVAEFQPIEDNNQWVKITLIALTSILLLGSGIGAAYWYRHRSAEEEMVSEVHDAEKQEQEPELAFIYEDEATTPQEASPAETDTLATPYADASTERKGIVTLQPPQGRYYVIVASYIDIDLARDYAKRLIRERPYVIILSPTPGAAFSKVAIAETNTLAEARRLKEELKEKYGQDIWVTKY